MPACPPSTAPRSPARRCRARCCSRRISRSGSPPTRWCAVEAEGAQARATGWLALSAWTRRRCKWKVSFTATQAPRQFSYADVDVDLTAPPPKIPRSTATRHGPRPGRGRTGAGEGARRRDSRNKQWLRCCERLQLFGFRCVERQQGPRDPSSAPCPRATTAKHVPARRLPRVHHAGSRAASRSHFEQTNTCLELPLPKNGRRLHGVAA